MNLKSTLVGASLALGCRFNPVPTDPLDSPALQAKMPRTPDGLSACDVRKLDDSLKNGNFRHSILRSLCFPSKTKEGGNDFLLPVPIETGHAISKTKERICVALSGSQSCAKEALR